MNNQLNNAVLLNVYFAIKESAWDTVRKSVKDSAKDVVRDSAWNSIWKTPENSIITSVEISAKDYFKQK